MVSLLDIIGPVMAGPSSSHTAGACRIGLFARGLGEIGRGMDIRYRETAGGSLAATPTGRKLAKERLVQLKGRKQ